MAFNPQLQHLEALIMHPGRSDGGGSEHHMVQQEGEEDWPSSPSDDNFKA
jgi:hypothetical protein